MSKKLVVLEDAVERVDWLRRAVPHVDVVWCPTVASFFEALSGMTVDGIGMLILDHDLGADTYDDDGRPATSISLSSTWPKDANGNTGMDVVYHLDAYRTVPIIVWSINTPRAQEMVVRLGERGLSAVHIPFGTQRVGTVAAIVAATQGVDDG